MRAPRDPQHAPRLARLGVVDPIDDLTDLEADLVRRRVLVEVEAVLRDLLAVLDRLEIALLGVEDQEDLLHRVDGDRLALLGREIAQVVDRVAVPADLVADWLQARVRQHRRGRRTERVAQLLGGVDDAFERRVVVDPRHVQALEVRASKGLGRLLKSLLGGHHPLFRRLRTRRRRGRRRRRCRLGGALLHSLGGLLGRTSALAGRRGGSCLLLRLRAASLGACRHGVLRCGKVVPCRAVTKNSPPETRSADAT